MKRVYLFLFVYLISLFFLGCSPQQRNEQKNLNDIINDLNFDALYPDAKEFRDQADLKTVENSGFMPEFYDLHLNLFPQQTFFKAQLNIKVKKINSNAKILTLNAGKNIVIKSVKAENSELPLIERNLNDVSYDASMIVAQQFDLHIDYELNGQNDGISYIKNNNSEVVQVWSRHQPNYARQWLVSFDWPGFKAPKRFTFTVPTDWKVLSNGDLKTIKNNTYVWEDPTPNSTYLYSFIAGKMEIHTIEKNNFYSLWIPEKFETNTQKILSEMKHAVQTYSSLFGSYPYSKLAVGVAYDFAGAMEHVNAVTFSHMNNHPTEGLDTSILYHEIAHQWFGDLVTCKTWDDLWLNEGFATYFETYMDEENNNEFEYRMEGHRKRYLSFDQRKVSDGSGGSGPIYDPTTSSTQKFNVLSYEKPAVVIHMLRNLLGDELFFKILKTYLNKYKYQTVITQNFIDVVNEVTQKDYTWFFKQWIFTKGHPVLHYSWDFKDSKLVLSVSQRREDITYILPIEVWIKTKSGELIQTVNIKSKQQEIVFDFAERPLAVVLDPRHRILSEIKTQKSNEELKHVLNSAHWLSQSDAFKLLSKDLSHEELKNLLATKNDYIKAEVVSSLGTKTDFSRVEYSKLILEYLKSKSAPLRIAAALNAQLADLTLIEDALLNTYLKDTSLYAQSFAGESLVKLKSEKVIPYFIKEVHQFPKRHYKMLMTAITGLSEMGVNSENERFMHIFKYELGPTRFYKITVAAALAKLKEKKATLMIAEELLNEQNPDMGLGYVKALEAMGDVSAKPYLLQIAQDSSRTKKLRSAAFATYKMLK